MEFVILAIGLGFMACATAITQVTINRMETMRRDFAELDQAQDEVIKAHIQVLKHWAKGECELQLKWSEEFERRLAAHTELLSKI